MTNTPPLAGPNGQQLFPAKLTGNGRINQPGTREARLTAGRSNPRVAAAHLYHHDSGANRYKKQKYYQNPGHRHSPVTHHVYLPAPAIALADADPAAYFLTAQLINYSRF
ncbi:hypothetical protein [Sodalis ligni]|uniref:hypothetical protein n=1 Tax=Sodalis ligni TaxID=2697027 RepID=UPI00104A422F|nr:hypothetical protein [Sodalis ligni]